MVLIIIIVKRKRGYYVVGFFIAAALLVLGGWWLLAGSKYIQVVAEPVYHGDPGDRSLALTCNVFWGEEYLYPMMDILDEKNVRVTFFIGGTWAKKFPDLVKEMHRRGHEIGTHGYSHPHPDNISRESNYRDIARSQEIIKGITGQKPVLYAPPYGERGPAVLQAAEELGCRTILWSIDTIDWKRPGPDVILERVISKAHNGGIVLMHPTAPTVEALPGIIDGLHEKGYKIVTVGEMLRRMDDKELEKDNKG